jgi:hypothetical protein
MRRRCRKRSSDNGHVADAQLEAVTYAGQAQEDLLPDGRRAGFMIGDGTGVGKGTKAAAIALDNWNKGRKKILWISMKPGLIKQAQRDLDWVQAAIKARPMDDWDYGQPINHEGVRLRHLRHVVAPIEKRGQDRHQTSVSAPSGVRPHSTVVRASEGRYVFSATLKSLSIMKGCFFLAIVAYCPVFPCGWLWARTVRSVSRAFPIDTTLVSFLDVVDEHTHGAPRDRSENPFASAVAECRRRWKINKQRKE